MNREESNAITEWIVSRTTLTLDNTEHTHQALSEAAELGVIEGMGTGVGRAGYDAAMRGGGTAGYTRADFAEVAGIYVRDALQELLDGTHMEGWVRTMLYDLLLLADHAQALGDHYLPDPAYVTWPDDDGTDEDEEN